LEPFNLTVVPNIILGTEVSAIEEEVIVEDELVVSDIISSERNHQKDSQCSSKQAVMEKKANQLPDRSIDSQISIQKIMYQPEKNLVVIQQS